jgi:hypothetical protein
MEGNADRHGEAPEAGADEHDLLSTSFLVVFYLQAQYSLTITFDNRLIAFAAFLRPSAVEACRGSQPWVARS